MSAKSRRRYGLIVIVCLAIILPRTLGLGAFNTADEKRWRANTADFITNLANGDLKHLMLQPHPGITLQWVATPTVLANTWTIRKLPLVLTLSVLIGFIGYGWWRLVGAKIAFFITLLLAINPLLIAHSRVYAMDALLASCLIISVLFLLLWQKVKQWRYLIFSAVAGAAAVLSKLSGIIIVPVAMILLFYWLFTSEQKERWTSFKACLIWLLAALLGAVVIFPSLLLNTRQVISDIVSWFGSDDYSRHQSGLWYYWRTLIFFSTPLHWVAVLTAPFFLLAKKVPARWRFYGLVFLLLAVLFTGQMSVGAKKGDRYILPVFLSLDVLAGLLLAYLFSLPGRGLAIVTAKWSLSGLILLQIMLLWSLQPYYLAYVNPITQSFFGERRHGWGEGLDLAANFLNQLAGAKQLTVASYYPLEFAHYFRGKTVAAHEHDHADVDYVVIYRAMFERGPQAWETDVVNHYRGQRPIKVITIAGLPMAWIYQR